MANETTLEDLVGLLKEDKNWEKGESKFTDGEYVTCKDNLTFNVYMLNVGNRDFRLGIYGSGVSETFGGELVKSLYESLAERYGSVDVEALKKERKENALKLALAKLRGE